MIIDVHCHYTLTARPATVADRFSFEPAERAGGLAWDSRIAPRLGRQLKWRILRHLMGIDARLRPGPQLDAAVEAFYRRHLFAKGPIDRHVLLAFDAYHTDDGRAVPFPERRDERGSDIYTSNSLVRDLCRRHPDRFLFGASVHPYRPDAVACVEEVFAAGACLLKWLPLHQNINVADPRSIAVLERCAALGLPLLVHHSEEFTLATQHPEYGPVAHLLDVLRGLRHRGRMPVTIVAHVATPVSPFGERASYRALRAALVGEFAQDPLFADISALTTLGKAHFLPGLARRQLLHAKLVFGSDFPVPLGWTVLRMQIPRWQRTIRANPSWSQQAALVYRHLGFNEIVFHRAGQILPNLNHFADRQADETPVNART